MKVCIAISTIDKTAGGPSRSVPLLAKGLIKCGIDVTLLTKRTSNMNLGMLENSGVKVKILDHTASYRKIKKYIESEDFDIIHLQSIWDPYYHFISKIARKNSIPYIMTPRGMLEPWSLSQKSLKKKFALTLYQKPDLNKAKCILATADMEAHSIRNIGITSPIVVIPNGIDIKEYVCKNKSDINRVKKQILFLSRIHQKKGIEILIDAWSSLANKYKDWHIIIAGNGDPEYISELNDKIKSLGLDRSIKIIKPVFGEDKIKLYQESSLFILPSYSENFGMVIAEAMSCGTPVITTTNTPWEMLNKNDIGWCIDLSTENLTMAISDALEMGTPKLFDKGQLASEFVKAEFEYDKVGQKMKAIYEWILKSYPFPEDISIYNL